MADRRQVDSQVPRAKAYMHALLPAIAYLAGDPAAAPILTFTGLAMALSVLAGPRFSLFGRLFNSIIRPAFNLEPGRPEDSRPHRFAEALGSIFLLAAAVFYLTGPVFVGQALALVVVALALLNAVGGICIGCQMYLLIRRTFAMNRPESPGAA
jgi:hypothetical protein